MAHIKQRSDSFIARLSEWLDDWTKVHLPWFWRFHLWFSDEVRQMDRKTFYLTWWVLMVTVIIGLVALIWFKF